MTFCLVSVCYGGTTYTNMLLKMLNNTIGTGLGIKRIFCNFLPSFTTRK